jgi:hypothetical protein
LFPSFSSDLGARFINKMTPTGPLGSTRKTSTVVIAIRVLDAIPSKFYTDVLVIMAAFDFRPVLYFIVLGGNQYLFIYFVLWA